MFPRSIFTLSALCVLACSNSIKPLTPESEGGAADATIVPQGVNVSARPGTNSAFTVVALTLVPAPSGAELYAAVSNDGDVAACNPSFSVELRDRDEQVLAAGISGLFVRDFYRLSDGSGTVAGCVSPGGRTMVAIAGLSFAEPIETVTHIVYASSYWFLEAVAIEGARVSDVQTVPRPGGVAYTGLLLNRFDFALDRPTVAVFPTNGGGRPLGVTYGARTQQLMPGDSWPFETNTSSQAGTGFDAYPMGGP